MKVRAVWNLLAVTALGLAFLLNEWLEPLPREMALLCAGAIIVCLYISQVQSGPVVKVLLVVILAFVSYLKGKAEHEQVSTDFETFKRAAERKQFVVDVDLATASKMIRDRDEQITQQDAKIGELESLVTKLRAEVYRPAAEKAPPLLDTDAVRRLNRGRGKRRVH